MAQDITGYRDLNETEIRGINLAKQFEKQFNDLLDEAEDGSNGRHIAMARSYIEIGTMFAVKAIAKPTS